MPQSGALTASDIIDGHTRHRRRARRCPAVDAGEGVVLAGTKKKIPA
jgi:hypothetical protein